MAYLSDKLECKIKLKNDQANIKRSLRWYSQEKKCILLFYKIKKFEFRQYSLALKFKATQLDGFFKSLIINIIKKKKFNYISQCVATNEI